MLSVSSSLNLSFAISLRHGETEVATILLGIVRMGVLSLGHWNILNEIAFQNITVICPNIAKWLMCRAFLSWKFWVRSLSHSIA